MNPTHLTKGAALALGLLTIAWPLAWSPAWTYLVAGLGAAAVLAAAFLSWRPGPALAVAAAVVSCAAAEVPLGAWARGQVPLVVAGVLAGAAVLAAFAVRPSGSAWLALAGLAAAVAAYLVALAAHR
jgi:hypothetical protein